MIRAFICAFIGTSFALSVSQCIPSSVPNPAPVPVPAPAPTVQIDAAPPPPPVLPVAGDRCSAAYTRILAIPCSLPDTWPDACIAARSHGATFNLFCFDSAHDCKTVEGCMGEP